MVAIGGYMSLGQTKYSNADAQVYRETAAIRTRRDAIIGRSGCCCVCAWLLTSHIILFSLYFSPRIQVSLYSINYSCTVAERQITCLWGSRVRVCRHRGVLIRPTIVLSIVPLWIGHFGSAILGRSYLDQAFGIQTL